MPFRVNLRWVLSGLLLVTGCHGGPARQTIKVAVPGGADQAEQFHQEGVRFLAEGKLSQAQLAFEAAIATDKGYGPAHNNLGKVYLQQQKLYEAAWEFQCACKLMPSRPEPENNLAMVFERAGKLIDAITHYAKARELAPHNAEILGNLVRARLRRGDRDASIQELLSQLVLEDTRPQWVTWAKEKLALVGGLQADPSPRDTMPKPEPATIFVPLKPEH